MDRQEDEGSLSSADFHSRAQKQILNAVFTALSETKMDWAAIAPFLAAARQVCVGDLQQNGSLRLHTMRAGEDGWVEAEEAFLGLSVADRDSGEEWLSETWWLSDIATANADRAEVEAIAAALRRTLAKLEAWLNDGKGGPADPEPPEGPA